MKLVSSTPVWTGSSLRGVRALSHLGEVLVFLQDRVSSDEDSTWWLVLVTTGGTLVADGRTDGRTVWFE